MPVEFQDVPKATIVLAGVVLLGEQPQRDKFADLVDTEIMSEMVVSSPVPTGPTPGSPANIGEAGLVLTLHRDRIQVISAPSRTAIERQYPSFDDLERLADVAGHAIEATELEGQRQIAYGFNIELVYRQGEEVSSEQYLAHRLFSNRQFGIENWPLVGGGGKFSFEGNNARWNLAVEPRANDNSGKRIYLSLNLHRNSQQVPNREEILDSLREIWERSHKFATELDEGV
jgi:hypothetical protein